MDLERSNPAGSGSQQSEAHPVAPAALPFANGSDERFQALLLGLASRAASESDPAALIRAFCRATREFFQVSGVYFWRRMSDGEFVGEQADGSQEDLFCGLRLRSEQSAVTADAVRTRRTIFVNDVDSGRYPVAANFHARAMMAAPLVVLNEVIGAATFIHDARPDFFNRDLADKATILTGQLGSLIEAARLTEASRQERRRAEILADVAQVLDGRPDVTVVVEALADRLRLLLGTRLVCILLRQEGPYELRAVSAETPQMAHSVRARHDRQTIRFVAEIAQRAAAAGEPLMIALTDEAHSLANLVSVGTLMAVPFRTARTQGAILVYPRVGADFTADDTNLVSAVAAFGGVALANAELYATASSQAHELHQLLDISSELGSCGDLDQFLQAFVARAADFLGFGRCLIALMEDNQFLVRYGVESGNARRVELLFPEGAATDRLRSKDVFWSDDVSSVAGANLEAVARYQIRQLLAVPLLGANAEVLGMFAVLDRLDHAGIQQEDVRRARALAAQVSVVLEATRNLHESAQHRTRAEALMGLARDIDGVRHLGELAERFLRCVRNFLEASQGVFSIFEGGHPHFVAYQSAEADGPAEVRSSQAADSSAAMVEEPQARQMDPGLERQLNQAIAALVEARPEAVITGTAEDLLGGEVASALGWQDCVVCRMMGVGGGIAGLVVLSGLGRIWSSEDGETLQIMAGHASMVLENARLFTRIEQANRHWLEIFDAIADFIVVHDESDKVLRVNRSLASFAGVPPRDLVGVGIGAALGQPDGFGPQSCPFCRSVVKDADEFVHPLLDRTYLVSTSRVHSAASEGYQTIHILKDITDRREAESRYRELFDNIQEGLFFSTPEGRFVEVNDATVRMLGYASREEILQIDIPKSLYFSVEQREHYRGLLTQQGHLRDFETTLRRKDGTPIRVLVNAFAMLDHAGQVIQYRGLMLDISGLRDSQSELLREREFSGKVLGNTQSFILVTDAAGHISYANRRWMDAGFVQPELLGRPFTELAAPGSLRPLMDALQSTLRGVAVETLELQLVRPNGGVGYFSVNLSPMRDEHARVTSVVVVMADITDSVLLRDKLVHTEKMAAVGQLVSGVAHEVNNPLTAILGFADLLMENPELPESARSDLRVILQQAQRTKQIVQNLLSFARQTPQQRSHVQVNTILRSTIQLRSYDFGSHGVEIVEHFDQELPEVLGDAHQLQQVFLNILNNAYDAVRESGPPARLEIMTTKSGGNIEISFCDNGYGIEHMDRIFDPFFTTKEIGKGTGLGLSICYGIVREHGGEILCHNNASGRGATFIVRLPTVVQAASFGIAAGVTQL